MKYGLYSIRDVKVGFNQPFTDINDNTAQRGFAYAINNNDIMHFSPKDYDLYKIGVFDVDSGVVEAFGVPQLVCDGLSLDGVDVK